MKLKTEVQENKARQIFQKTNISYPLISNDNKCSKFGVLCFLVTSVLRFAFLSYYRVFCSGVLVLLFIMYNLQVWQQKVRSMQVLHAYQINFTIQFIIFERILHINMLIKIPLTLSIHLLAGLYFLASVCLLYQPIASPCTFVIVN